MSAGGKTLKNIRFMWGLLFMLTVFFSVVLFIGLSIAGLVGLVANIFPGVAKGWRQRVVALGMLAGATGLWLLAADIIRNIDGPPTPPAPPPPTKVQSMTADNTRP